MIEERVKIQSPISQNWQVLKLGQICKTTSGGTPSRGNAAFYRGSIPWVKSGELEKGVIYDTEEKISEEAVKSSSAKIFPKGTLLIALYGATIGKMAFLGVDAATNQAVCGIFKNDNVDLKYLYYFLLFKRPKLIQQGIGGAQPNISQTILKDLDVPLPPLPIQQAIVGKLEALFSELDKGIEQLKTARQQLRTYRQAVLKAAFEGRLTGEHVTDGELPEGWKWVKIREISNVVRGGSPRPAGDPKFYDGNIPFLKVRDVTKDNGIYLKEYEYTIKEAGLNRTRQIEPNTLLLSNSGATLGIPKICAIHATINDGIAAFLNLDHQLLHFMYYFWQSKTKELRTINMGAAQPNLNTDLIKDYDFPLPPLAKADEVVSEIESRLSVADKLEETIAQGLQQAEALRQSILKRAFEGELLKSI